MSENKPSIWAVVPAAGCGQRMQSSTPKQYLALNNKPVIAHTIETLLACDDIQKIIVALDHDDQYWLSTGLAKHPKIHTVQGGAHRCQSVFNGLLALQNIAEKQDWVIVHDAVRPCLSFTDLDKLIIKTHSHLVGGILGVPLIGTIKRCNDNNVVTNTVDRNHLWQALTPQMFRYEFLLSGLTKAIESQHWVTDEAAAIELLGLQALMVQGSAQNIKITHQDDLAIAQKILSEELAYEFEH